MGSRGKSNDNLKWASDLERQYTMAGNRPEGDGWMTFKQVREQIGCGVCKCRRVIGLAKVAGDIEVFHGSEKSPTTGHLCRQIWYRPTFPLLRPDDHLPLKAKKNFVRINSKK